MLTTHHSLNASDARLLLDAARHHALSIGVPENIAIVDAGGRLLSFLRMDGAKFHSIETAMAKAHSAASTGQPTGGAPVEVGIMVGLATRGSFTNMPGGLPVIVDDEVVGAIGIGSGTPEQDIEVAQAALDALMAN